MNGDIFRDISNQLLKAADMIDNMSAQINYLENKTVQLEDKIHKNDELKKALANLLLDDNM